MVIKIQFGGSFPDEDDKSICPVCGKLEYCFWEGVQEKSVCATCADFIENVNTLNIVELSLLSKNMLQKHIYGRKKDV